MTVGTVRWFDVRKGYGFLKPDEGGVDVLVSLCALERAGMASLDQGQRLSFEVVRDERIGRSCAENSQRLRIKGWRQTSPGRTGQADGGPAFRASRRRGRRKGPAGHPHGSRS